MKRVVILGSTGSIGRNALRVAAALPDRIRVVGLAAGRNAAAVLEQARRFGVRRVALLDAGSAALCRREAPEGMAVLEGAEGVAALAAEPAADLVLCAVVGLAGLRPVLAALESGKHVALATKEVLVGAGGIVMDAARRRGVRVLPVDSEHSAMLQCIDGACPGAGGDADGPVRRLILTASGGPFHGRPETDLDAVTVAQALDHPRWSMGPKVTVDSATLMNKGLELIEAHWLFGLPAERIDIVLHPESIVHSLVEFRDGNVLGQLSLPDMRYAIQYALTWPARVDGGLPGVDLTALGTLTFAPPDGVRFPALGLAREAARRGGTLPAVLNAANETAVQRFLEGTLRFADIWRTVERVMDGHTVVNAPDLDTILAADAWARRRAMEG
jgi:1-deoxy-D-xylulose-5-phosphate reductoisomerase